MEVTTGYFRSRKMKFKCFYCTLFKSTKISFGAKIRPEALALAQLTQKMSYN